jgi:hypothetical protein
MPAKTARFEIVRNAGFYSSPATCTAVMNQYSHISIRNLNILKATICTIKYGYAPLQMFFEALIFIGKYMLQLW